MFLHICLQIYILLYLIIYKRGVSGVLGVSGALGGVGGSCCPRWCPRWCGGVVSSVVWCPRWCGVGVLGGVSGVLGGGGVWCPRWCRWTIQGGRGGSWCPRWCPRCGGALGGIYAAATQAGTHEAPQCGGALASESKFQGRIDECDSSNYQLFRCPF